MVNDSANVRSSGRSFYVCGPATGKARLPTVDSLLVGTTRRSVHTYIHTYMKFITRCIVEDGSNQRRGLLLGAGFRKK